MTSRADETKAHERGENQQEAWRNDPQAHVLNQLNLCTCGCASKVVGFGMQALDEEDRVGFEMRFSQWTSWEPELVFGLGDNAVAAIGSGGEVLVMTFWGDLHLSPQLIEDDYPMLRCGEYFWEGLQGRALPFKVPLNLDLVHAQFCLYTLHLDLQVVLFRKANELYYNAVKKYSDALEEYTVTVKLHAGLAKLHSDAVKHTGEARKMMRIASGEDTTMSILKMKMLAQEEQVSVLKQEMLSLEEELSIAVEKLAVLKTYNLDCVVFDLCKCWCI